MSSQDICVCGDLRCEHVNMTGASYLTETCYGFRLVEEDPAELVFGRDFNND